VDYIFVPPAVLYSAPVEFQERGKKDSVTPKTSAAGAVEVEGSRDENDANSSGDGTGRDP
jgi:hypothetical protein